MTRRTRVVLGLAMILVGNSAYLWADGVVKALFVLGVAPVGILVGAWPYRNRRRGDATGASDQTPL